MEPSSTRIQPHGKDGYVAANDVRLHCLEYGDGPVSIVIVPGITSPAITWEFVAEALARDYRVYTLDVRGRGLSDVTPAGTYGLPTYAADLAGFVRGLGLARPVVLGHSMGARIVAAYGALHAPAGTPLIVVDPPLSGPGRPPYPSPLESYTSAIQQARAGTTVAELRPRYPTWDDRQLQIRADWLGTCDLTAVSETHHNFQLEDFFGYWRRCQPPLLFMYGQQSLAVAAEDVLEIRGANPAAEIVGISGAAHMIPWDNLAEFLAVTRHWIDGVMR